MSIERTLSNRRQLTKHNYKNILQVSAWTFLAGGIAALISFIPELSFPAQFAFIPAVINTLLYSAQEFAREQKTIE